MEVFLSSGAFSTRSLPDILQACRKHGVRKLELSPGIAYASDVLDVARAASRDMTFLLHNYFPPPKIPFTVNLAARDADLERRSMELSMTAIDFCGELKIPFFTVHAGFAFDVPPDALGSSEKQAALPDSAYEDLDRALDRFRKNVVKLAARAKERGVRILFENNCLVPEYYGLARKNPLLLSHPDDIAAFFDELNEPAAGLLLDVAHAEVTCRSLGLDKDAFVTKVLPHVSAWHLSCTDGVHDNNRPLTKDAWFWKHVLKKKNLDMVIEVYRIDPSLMRQQIALVEQIAS